MLQNTREKNRRHGTGGREGNSGADGDSASAAAAAAAAMTSRNDWTSSDNKRIGTEVLGKLKCVKIAKDLSRETACYYTLVMHLGSVCDTPRMRDELRQCRVRALELAQQNKAALLPHLRGRMHDKEELGSYEKLWNDYASCLELLLQQLFATLIVERRFPGDSSGKSTIANLIRTGLTESVENTLGLCKAAARQDSTMNDSTAALSAMSSSSSSSASLSSSASVGSASSGARTAWSNKPKAEFNTLEKDISDISKVLTDIRNLIYLKPWDMEGEQPQIKESKDYPIIESGFVSVFRKRLQSTRFICLIVFLICVVIVIIVSVPLAVRL